MPGTVYWELRSVHMFRTQPPNPLGMLWCGVCLYRVRLLGLTGVQRLSYHLDHFSRSKPISGTLYLDSSDHYAASQDELEEWQFSHSLLIAHHSGIRWSVLRVVIGSDARSSLPKITE